MKGHWTKSLPSWSNQTRENHLHRQEVLISCAWIALYGCEVVPCRRKRRGTANLQVIKSNHWRCFALCSVRPQFVCRGTSRITNLRSDSQRGIIILCPTLFPLHFKCSAELFFSTRLKQNVKSKTAIVGIKFFVISTVSWNHFNFWSSSNLIFTRENVFIYSSFIKLIWL